MAMTTRRLHPDDEAALAALFDDLRAQPVKLPRGYLTRVLADAEAVAAAPVPRPATALARPGWIRRLLASSFGRAAGGLAMAGIVGFGLGLGGGLSGASWLSAAAPLLFAADSDSALTLLPEADSFVIALAEDEGASQ